MKRQSDKQLNKDDWEKGDSPEHRSKDTAASEKIIKERILKRAKLGGSTHIESESPLKLFSQGLLTGKVSAIKDTAIKMISSSKPISSLVEELSQDSGGSQDTSTKHSQANSVCSDDVSIPEYLDNIFSRNISRLNTAVSKWIASQVVKNPICDLTPIFGDYQRYFKEFSREAHLSPSASASPTNNHSDTPYRPTQGVTTITPTLESTEITSASVQPLRGLLFSKPSTQVHSFSSPASQTSKLTFSSTASEPRPLRFNPFTKPTISKPTDPPVPPSSLSRALDPPQLKTGSVLDALKLATTLSKKDVLSGQEAPTPVTSSSTSLILPSTIPLSLSIPGVKPLSTTSTSFKFNPIPLPIFPSAPSLSELIPSNSAPFPTLVNKPNSPVVDGDDGEDNTEQERPTTPPALKLDTEHTVFSCNSKIFTKREGSFVDIGICILRVRKNPDTEKTQLLVRNNTTFARIIINTIITETTPLSKPRDKEVMIICPKQETETESPLEENQSPMDTFLIRVKTIEFAATLFSLLDEAKRKRMIKTA